MRKTVAFGFVGTVLDYAGARQSALVEMASDTLFMPARIVSHRIGWNCCTTPARARYLKRLNAISPAFRQKQKSVSVEIELHNPSGFRRGLRLPA